MAISQLSLTDFRNLESATLDFDKRLNLVCGANGSGKTSLLEAIYVLCQAQSFRSHQLANCIAHDRTGFMLFGRFDQFKAGLSRNRKNLQIRVDGDNVRRRSDLVRLAPATIVNPESFLLIEGAPAKRRAYLDWCLFHVEPSYADHWRAFQHALKQRNRLLKTRQDLNLLDYWDQHLLEPSLRLCRMREDCARQLQETIETRCGDLLENLALDLRYRRGWDENSDLSLCLERHRGQDIRAGFTGIGIHRDDVELTSNGRKAAEVLSRGQGKRVCLALLLASLQLVNEKADKPVILLVDDLHSELDERAQKQVYRQLVEMNLQLFISNIEESAPAALEAKEFKMFHVKHGTIRPRVFS